MPRFLSKLFRRKGAAAEESTNKKPKKVSKRHARTKSKGSKDEGEKASEPLQPLDKNENAQLNRTPTATTASDRGSSASRQPSKAGVVSPRVHQDVKSSARRTSAANSGGPVDLDDTDMEESDVENREGKNLSPRLSFHQLQQFNRQQHPNAASQQNAHHLYVHSPTNDAARRDSLENGSDASSSDFNLSTDAEDTEYENMRRRGGAPPYLNTSNLDTSGLSAMSSPTNYTTDDDNAIFPALQTDDEATQAQDDSLAPDDEAQGLRIMPMAHETEDDMRAWTLSPTSQPSTKSSSENKPISPKFQNGFHSSSSSTNKKTPKVVDVPEQAPAAKKKTTNTVPEDVFGSKDAFGNFANFDEVFPMEQSRPTKPSRSFLVEGPPPEQQQRRKASSSASAAPPQETSLSDLLAQAKRKSSRSKRGSSSVNSAPVITSQYLRETHRLGHRSSGSDARSVDKTTSVSDIIQSLEATNASRGGSSSSIKRSSSRSHSRRHHHHHHHDDAHSHTSNGGTSTRSAKERLREKRRQERNRNIGSDDSDNEEAESWLFDQVSESLGPRGVAADMESLGGRSNRSKNSAGNKSHRSHRSHKSHRSHRSSRRKKSSSESVDSRNSRSSRYSHRSTRSYLSQMSEQSRSVANDLLRLEMQLAMVGSQEVTDQETGKGSGSVAGSTGGASRASRTSRTSRNRSSGRSGSVSKRSKMQVIAPPGKLGIILANKADSKGTVVSGVRTSSVLAEKISPGDRIIAIDGEDVSLMTVSEITTIMARKSDFERQLTIMTTPKHLGLHSKSDFSSSDAGDGYYRR